MALKMIVAPPLSDVAQGVAGLWGIEAQGFSPDGSLLLVKVVYSDSAYPLIATRSAFWSYDVSAGQYGACINNLIASDHAVEVSDVSISSFGGQTQLVATYRDTQATLGLDLNRLALIRNGVLLHSDLVAFVSGNQADAFIDSSRTTSDGRFVAIETAASNLASNLDTNGCKDIYVFDLVLNTSRLVTTINGAESNFDSVLGDVMVGADGSLSVAFQSSQAFTAQDANGVDDVFVWRMAAGDFESFNSGTISLISRTGAGAAGGTNPHLNLNGAVFTSDSGAFSAGDQNNANDVWQSVGTSVVPVEIGNSGTLAEETSLASSSGNGRFIAVVTRSPEIAGQTGVDQLVLVDNVAKSNVIVSKSEAGALADDAVISPVLSANGRLLAFSSQASNLGSALDGQMHLYLATVDSGHTLQGLAYDWKSHTLLNGVQLSAIDHAGVASSTDLMDLRNAHFDASSGVLSVDLWATPTSLAGNLDFVATSAHASALRFTSTLSADWSVVTSTDSPGQLSLAAISLVGTSAPVKIGTLEVNMPDGTQDASVGLSNMAVGASAAADQILSMTLGASANDGTYSFSTLGADSYNIGASRPTTDTGNVINSADALAALRISVGLNPNPDPDGAGPLSALRVSPYQIMAADVNNSGTITSADALAILRMAVKLSTALPQEWFFVEETRDFWDEATSSFTLTRTAAAWDHAITANVTQDTTVNLVGVLKGDVNGSWAAPAGSQDLDVLQPTYFQDLVTTTLIGVPLDQWGV